MNADFCTIMFLGKPLVKLKIVYRYHYNQELRNSVDCCVCLACVRECKHVWTECHLDVFDPFEHT